MSVCVRAHRIWLLALPFVLMVVLVSGCASQETAVREATERAIDSPAVGEAFPNNDYYPLLPDERLPELAYTHEPIYKVCIVALGQMSYELGEVAIEGDAPRLR